MGRVARAASLAACSFLSGTADAQENVLLILADDLGVDRVAAYGAHPDPGNTPNIDSLAERGVLFRRAWSYPVCSPTRATIMTGRYGFRTGIGMLIRESSDSVVGLSLEEQTLPEVIAPSYSSAVLGKWHLANNFTQGVTHPLDSGFDYHAGSMFNLQGQSSANEQNYFDWQKNVNGVIENSTTYATTDTVDDALRAMETLPEPWFIYLPFNAPHKPFHAPPDHLHSFDLSGNPDNSPVVHMMAMTEAMDTEIGRLMAGVDESNTTVIFLGDNGTSESATTAPFDPEHAKGTLYEGGINVPFIVVSPRVSEPGSECDALVCATDIFPTVREIAGLGGGSRDGVSLLPYLADPSRQSIRPYIYSEIFGPNGSTSYNRLRRAIRNGRYKLIDRRTDLEREFYDLETDPFELNDLLQGDMTLEQATALCELETALVRLWNTR